jgi:WD40 repeat protein
MRIWNCVLLLGWASLTLLASLMAAHRANANAIVDAQDTPQIVAPQFVLQVGHRSNVTALSFSGDGRLLASGSFDGSAKLWDTATGCVMLSLTHGTRGGVDGVALSPDGKTLVTFAAGTDGVQVWDVATGQKLRKLPVYGQIAFSPDGRWLAADDDEGSIVLFDAVTWTEARRLKWRENEEDREHLKQVLFSPMAPVWL